MNNMVIIYSKDIVDLFYIGSMRDIKEYLRYIVLKK